MLHPIVSRRRRNPGDLATIFLLSAVCFFCLSQTLQAQTTVFTYQGKLTDGGAPANGNYDFEFKLFADNAGGTALGTQTKLNVAVSAGIFTVGLDFGACANCFNGAPRFLDIGVRVAGGGTFIPLAPRQPITSTPYAIRSLNASSADGLSVACVNCITSSQIQSVQGSQVSGVIPVASIPQGSPSYIQNTTSPQATSNFNISGNGTAAGTLSANVVNATTQYNIGGFRVLTAPGSGNTFAGLNAGTNNTTGGGNTFFGSNAGSANTTNCCNAYFGNGAGINSTGHSNAFFGNQSGESNTTGIINSFFGNLAGQKNTTGSGNAFFGSGAGLFNTTGNSNAFFGTSAGSNTTSSDNSFFGTEAGNANTSGTNNAFFGRSAGLLNTTGSENSFFGREVGLNNTTGNNNSFFGKHAGFQNTTGSSNSFFGWEAGLNNTTGNSNSFFGFIAGRFNTGGFNSFFGTAAGLSNTTENFNTFIGYTSNGEAGITNATAIGAYAKVTQSNSLVLGSINGVNGAFADTNVGIGTTSPSTRLHVAASFNGSATNPANHVSLFQNTSTGTSADVMALKIGRSTNPESSNNFITFFKGDDATVGSIEGNGSGGVVLAGPGSDYAEWLPRLNPDERIEPGEVVGLYGGRVTKATRGAEQVMVVSTGPIVAGNDPGEQARSRYSQVAFIGQVMVKVRGMVQAGDFILASGQADGVGVAISPECISAEAYAKVVGQAWQASSEPGVKTVRMAVGLMRQDPAVNRLLEQSQKQTAQIVALKQQNAALQEHNAALDARLTALEQQARSVTSGKQASGRGGKVSRVHRVLKRWMRRLNLICSIRSIRGKG